MNSILRIAVSISMLLCIPGCDRPGTPPSGLKIKIGVIAPNSGPDSVLGKGGVKGINIAMELDPYLENGDEIELIVENDHSDPDKTVSALENLANNHAVSAILLLSGSNSAIAVAKVADRYKTPVLATIATNPEVTNHSKLVSQLVFDNTVQATVAAMFVRDELFVRRVAVFRNPESAYSSHLARVFADKFKAVGGRITDFIELSDVPVNHAKLLERVRRNDPELLYMPTGAGFIVAIAKELNNLDWSPKMMAAEGFLSTVISHYDSDRHLVSGMFTTALYPSDMRLSSYGKRLSKYVDKTDVNIYMLTGMEGYGLLLNAMNRCDTPVDRNCINQNIHSTANFTGIADKISVGSDGKAHRALFVNRIDGYEIKTVVKVN
jgi:branched-chain amino acid transport system substrate-binding protein